MKQTGKILLLLLVIVASLASAQNRRRRVADNIYQTEGTFPTAREAVGDSYPKWDYGPRFQKDVFTFVRIEYDVDPEHPGHAGNDRWKIDFPDSDMNFSFRLQQLTSLKVNPDPVHIRLTDKQLFDYPFIYIVEPGKLKFSDEEVEVLRKYLLNGGFVMFDDFWGEFDWEHFYGEIKRVFPDREPRDLDLIHPIFHGVFDLKEKPQVPNIDIGAQSQWTGITWERADAKEVHYKAILDDKGRIMAMICHNTDLGDGWEKEGENEYYFHEFSEKKAYPLGVNIIFYAMTH